MFTRNFEIQTNRPIRVLIIDKTTYDYFASNIGMMYTY